MHSTGDKGITVAIYVACVASVLSVILLVYFFISAPIGLTNIRKILAENSEIEKYRHALVEKEKELKDLEKELEEQQVKVKEKNDLIEEKADEIEDKVAELKERGL
jgi:peptidoglycan hydrolase CwlO-like protein